MRYRVTAITVLLSVLLCLYNYTGYDPHNMVFFMFSIPGWFADMFVDIHKLNVVLMYVLTVASWAAIGLFCDWMIARDRRKRSA